MTSLAPARPSVLTWDQLRGPEFTAMAADIITGALPDGPALAALTHVRTAHYAVYRAATADGGDWLVRIGIAAEEDDAAPDNSGYQGTSVTSPTGQRREMELAKGFASAGAAVSVPAHLICAEGLDVLWVPFLVGNSLPLTAAQWHGALTALTAYKPAQELPVFTNRAKSFARLDQIPDLLTNPLRNRYDTQMEALFESATSWSIVHGDAHAGNALNIGGEAVLFDFDTSCWAPSVWDLTHLINRAGAVGNTGYTAKELIALSPYTAAEVSAALELRKIAAEIARLHRSHGTPAASREPALAAA